MEILFFPSVIACIILASIIFGWIQDKRKVLIVPVLISLSSAGQVQADKAYHVAAGVTISSIASGVTYHLTDRKDVALLTGFTAGTLAGLAKELWDAKGNGTPSHDDLIWTICGSGIGSFGMTIVIQERRNRNVKL